MVVVELCFLYCIHLLWIVWSFWWGWHFYIVDEEITFHDSWDVLVAEHYIYLAEACAYIATAMRVGNKRRQVEVEADLRMK